MKKVNKGILDNDIVISAENIQKMGEIVALSCIKTVIVRSGKNLHYLYKGLLRDINRKQDDFSPFSDGYEIAQEAMLFLSEHIGKKLGDSYTTKYGKVVTIKAGCYRRTDDYLKKQYTRHMTNTVSLDERMTSEPETTLNEDNKNDYTAFDGLITKMKLTKGEQETLSHLMVGLSCLQIARLHGDINDKDYQKQIIDHLVSQVFVSDDNTTVLFNLRGGKDTEKLTVENINEAINDASAVRTQTSPFHHS